MPIAAFIPGGLIKSSDDNSNFSDIATALTQSLATTGVSTMTGPINAAAGLVTAPGYTFNGSSKTGFYLAGANQIGWTANGVLGATFNSDLSVTFAGAVSAGKGTVPIGTVVDFAGSAAPTGWLLCFGQLVSTTTFAGLFAVLSTTYGSGGGTFGIPDYRGRATFGQDNMGGVAANRITVAGNNFNGTVLGGSQDRQNATLITGNLPAYTPAGSVSNGAISVASLGTGGAIAGSSNDGPFAILSGGNAISASQGASTFTGSAQGGTSTSFGILPNAIITNKIIYAGV